MKLSFEQIKEITVGAVRVVQTEEGIRFFKCTQKQIDAWMRQRPDLGKNAAASTGIRLDFHTTSQNLTFRILAGEKFEVHINGLLAEAYSFKEAQTVSLALRDPLGERREDYRVTILFPFHGNGGVLDYIELDDGATVRRHEFDCRLLFIGDSITQGWQSSLDSLSYAYRVSDFYNAESVNQGIGGSFFNEEAFDDLPFDPDVVFVAYGTNDFTFYKTYEELQTHCSAHLSLIAEAYRGKPVFVISPIWRDDHHDRAMGSFAECRRIVAETAESLGLIHVDGLTLVPPVAALYNDGYLHPNDAGFALYTEHLIKEIESHL